MNTSNGRTEQTDPSRRRWSRSAGAALAWFSRAALASTLAVFLSVGLGACGDSSSAVTQQPALVVLSTPGGAAARLTALGATLQLSAQVTDANGRAIGGAQVAWSSSDPSVASVDATGLATALANGSTTIFAKSGAAQGSIGLVVSQLPGTISLFPLEATVEKGGTATFTASSADPLGHPVAGAQFAWSASPTSVATVAGQAAGGAASALATGLALGDAVISVVEGDRSATATLHVVAPGVAAVIVDTAAPPTLTRIGATFQLRAHAADSLGLPLPEAAVSWRSSAPGVVVVDALGLATAVGNGTSTVFARAGTQESSVQLAVAQAVDHLAIAAPGGASPALTALGASLQLGAQAFDAGGAPVAGVSFLWSACDGTPFAPGCLGAILAVDGAGRVTSLANGTGYVTVQSADGAAATSVPILVEQRASSVAIVPADVRLALGTSVQLVAVVKDANGRVDVAPFVVGWSSSDPSLVAVSASGLATVTSSLAVAASTTLRAIVTDGGGQHSGETTVTADPLAVPVDHLLLLAGGTTTLDRLGAARQLSVSARDAADQPIPGVPFAWSSGDDLVLSLAPDSPGSATATARALSNGSATVRVDVGGASSTIPFVVRQEVATLEVAPTGTPAALSSIGQTLQLLARDGGGAAIPSGLAYVACNGTSTPPCAASTVVSVDGTGRVAALRDGGARITASTAPGSSAPSGSIDVAVAQQVAAILAGPAGTSSTLLTGSGQTLQLRAVDAGGSDVDPSTLSWTSTNPAAATVDASGLVTAVTDGATAIQAQTPFDAGRTIGVTVSRQVGSIEVATPGASSTLSSVGDTLQLRVRDTAGALLTDGLFWLGTNAGVATVDGAGLTSAVGNGTCTIVVTRNVHGSVADFVVTVSQRVVSVAPAAPAPLHSLGDSVQLAAFDARSNAVSGALWSACDGASSPSPPVGCPGTVATVDSSGKVTAQGNGSTRVYAQRGGGAAFADLSVAQQFVAVQVSPPSTSVAVGSTVPFAASGVDGRGHPVPGLPVATWTSSNPAAASVDATTGVATGHTAPASVTITATIGSATGTAALSVTVY